MCMQPDPDSVLFLAAFLVSALGFWTKMLMSLNHILVYTCNSFGLVSVKGITVVLVRFRKSPLEFL